MFLFKKCIAVERLAMCGTCPRTFALENVMGVKVYQDILFC